MTKILVKLGLQQRVLPEYRAPFFDALAEACQNGLHVYAGHGRQSEAIVSAAELRLAQYTKANNLHLLQGSFYTCVQTNFMEWLEEWKPEVLIVEANPRYLTTPQAVRWMHAHKHPVIGWGLGAPGARGIHEALRYRFLQSLDAMIAYSQTGAEQYRAVGCKYGKVFVAPNAVTPKPGKSALVRPVKFKDNRPTVVFVGRLQKRKKIDLLLQACTRLPEALQPRLLIVGDGPEREELQTLAARVYPQAEFAGSKFGADLDEYYAAADLFVLPGTGGLAVQQAMSHSLPVLVGEADGTQSELVRPENGWLVKDISVETLTAALQSALQDVKRLREMGLASYRIVAEEVNLERMVEAFAQAIESVT
jgi:glycosyltransferase involved in cell wall biosynthesis